MTLREGAETIIDQCLKIQEDEEVLVLNDGNDQDLIDSLLNVLSDREIEYELMEYETPENHGEDPPKRVAERMKEVDVVIAPTLKSQTHTQATHKAADADTRIGTSPKVNKEIWNGALQADYEEVSRITDSVEEALNGVEEVRIKTPRGTDLILEIDSNLLTPSKGFVHEPGSIGNMPSGEVFTGPISAEGKLVIGRNPYEEDEGALINIENGKVKSIEDTSEDSNIKKTIEEVDGARNVAEFGFGTNPKAEFIGHTLQDEKILGTVHVALGDNCFCFPDGHEKQVESDIHWDFVLQNPTVWFDDEKVLDNGEPIFLED